MKTRLPQENIPWQPCFILEENAAGTLLSRGKKGAAF